MTEGEKSIIRLLDRISLPGYTFRGRVLYQYWILWAEYFEADIVTGVPMKQKTREWLIDPVKMNEAQIVQTALKCALTSAEHKIREHFRYKGQLIFGPHFNLDDLVTLCESGAEEKAA